MDWTRYDACASETLREGREWEARVRRWRRNWIIATVGACLWTVGLVVLAAFVSPWQAPGAVIGVGLVAMTSNRIAWAQAAIDEAVRLNRQTEALIEVAMETRRDEG